MLVGHILMHCPHFMQRDRKTSSGKAPGGRTTPGFVLAAVSPSSRISGTAAAPDITDIRNALLVISGDRISPDAEGALLNPIRSGLHV